MAQEERDALFSLIKECLTGNGYYVGNSEVAKVLREVADYWDD